MKITCPSCATELKVLVTSTAEPEKRARVNPDITPLTDVALRDVYDVLYKIGPFRKTSAELYFHYMDHCIEIGRRRPLSKNAFARALGQYGAQRWRTATSRGYELAAVPQAPLGMTPEARERFEAAHQRGGGPTIQPLLDKVRDPIVPTEPAGLAGLPFEMDLPAEVDGDSTT